MTQVMRNGTRHLTNRRQAFRGYQFLSRSAQPVPHPVKRFSQFTQLPRTRTLQLIVEVACSEGSGPGH